MDMGVSDNLDGEQAAIARLRRKEAYLRTINEFALSLINVSRRDELLWYTVREIVQNLGFVDCVVYLLDPSRNVLVQEAAIGEKNPEGDEILNRLEIPVGTGITGYVAQNRQPQIVADLAKDERYLADINPAVSEICVPLIFEDRLLGVIDCEDPRRDHFNTDHLEILTTIAAMLSSKLVQIESRERLDQTQKLEVVSQITGGIAHDFNNFLAVVIGNLEMAQEAAAAGQDVTRFLDIAMQGAQKGGDLTRRLQTFSSREGVEMRVQDVIRLVREITPLLEKYLGRSFDLQTSICDAPCYAVVDPTQFESALLNLVVNARDAMPHGGRVCLQVAPAAIKPGQEDQTPVAAVKISLTDEGAGMPTTVAEHATEPFFTTKEGGRGRGLGLSMVKRFAEQFGGHLELRSTPGKGTVVEILLPCSDQPAEPDAAPSEVSRANLDGGGQVVLIVEDDDNVMDVAIAYLGSLGYRTISAGDGVAAMKILDSNEHIDILISDVMLPDGMQGQDIVARAREVRPDLRLMLMSGYAGSSSDVDGEQRDFDVPLLRKPFRREQLARALLEL